MAVWCGTEAQVSKTALPVLLRTVLPAGLAGSHRAVRWSSPWSSREHCWEEQQKGVGCHSAGAIPPRKGAVLGKHWQAVPWGWPTTRRAQRTQAAVGGKLAGGLYISEICLQRDTGQSKAWPSSQPQWCLVEVSWSVLVSTGKK